MKTSLPMAVVFSEVATTGRFCCLKKAHSAPVGRGRPCPRWPCRTGPSPQGEGGDGRGIRSCAGGFWGGWREEARLRASRCDAAFLTPRESGGALSTSSDLDTRWTERRWGLRSAWPGTWSPGGRPSPSHTCTTETAWLRRTARSAPRYALSARHTLAPQNRRHVLPKPLGSVTKEPCCLWLRREAPDKQLSGYHERQLLRVLTKRDFAWSLSYRRLLLTTGSSNCVALKLFSNPGL